MFGVFEDKPEPEPVAAVVAVDDAAAVGAAAAVNAVVVVAAAVVVAVVAAAEIGRIRQVAELTVMWGSHSSGAYDTDDREMQM